MDLLYLLGRKLKISRDYNDGLSMYFSKTQVDTWNFYGFRPSLTTRSTRAFLNVPACNIIEQLSRTTLRCRALTWRHIRNLQPAKLLTTALFCFALNAHLKAQRVAKQNDFMSQVELVTKRNLRCCKTM